MSEILSFSFQFRCRFDLRAFRKNKKAENFFCAVGSFLLPAAEFCTRSHCRREYQILFQVNFSPWIPLRVLRNNHQLGSAIYSSRHTFVLILLPSRSSYKMWRALKAPIRNLLPSKWHYRIASIKLPGCNHVVGSPKRCSSGGAKVHREAQKILPNRIIHRSTGENFWFIFSITLPRPPPHIGKSLNRLPLTIRWKLNLILQAEDAETSEIEIELLRDAFLS